MNQAICTRSAVITAFFTALSIANPCHAAESLTENVSTNVKATTVIAISGGGGFGVSIANRETRADVAVVENKNGTVRNVAQRVDATTVIGIGGSARVGGVYQGN